MHCIVCIVCIVSLAYLILFVEMFNSVDELDKLIHVDSGASFPRNELQRLKLAAATAEHFDSADVAWPKMLPERSCDV